MVKRRADSAHMAREAMETWDGNRCSDGNMGNGVLRVSTMPRPAIQKQSLLFAADAFVAALGAVPAEDWCRTWAAGRTIMLRRTSKKVKEAVDKMRLPAVVRLSRRFWDDARNGTGEEKRQVVLRQLAAMTGWCRISTLELDLCYWP